MPASNALEAADEDSILTAKQVDQTSRGRAASKRGLEPAYAVSSNSRTSRAASPEGDPAALAGQYAGPSSAYSFLRRAWRRFGLQSGEKEEAELNQAVPIFQYGDKQLPRGSDGAATFVFPDRQQTTELFSIYFDFAMPTYVLKPQLTSNILLSTLNTVDCAFADLSDPSIQLPIPPSAHRL